MNDVTDHVQQERLRRRTFALISHPDAGKTTLTEKLLLFGGSIETAGAVRGRKSQRTAKSDWMELEKQRGISVSSTVLTFQYADNQINLLDTPGHHDFSEDTYRTLMAADAAVMVLDMAKGIESQTEKLFQVCKLRKLPVLTFVNKVDRPGRAPLEILEEIEQKFSIEAVPHHWPIGTGRDFCGIIELSTDQVHLFTNRDGQKRQDAGVFQWEELTERVINQCPSLPVSAALADAKSLATIREEVELIRLAGTEFRLDDFLRGKQTAVYFGSALTNFGVEAFLRGFLQLCPAPGNRPDKTQKDLANHSGFSGFVFKIQANLDPNHRDRVAFARVCSGEFKRDMEVTVARSGKRIRLPRALRIFGQDRQTMDEAFPGDIVGLVCPGEFRLGDTLYAGRPIQFDPLPQFSPEFFAVLECPDTSRRKQFDRGLSQLAEEGAIQIFNNVRSTHREMILGAVGELQFDVVRFRLEGEYNAPTRLSWRQFKLTRWFSAPEQGALSIKLPYSAIHVHDQFGHDAVLLQTQYDVQILERENPGISFHSIRTADVQPAV